MKNKKLWFMTLVLVLILTIMGCDIAKAETVKSTDNNVVTEAFDESLKADKEPNEKNSKNEEELEVGLIPNGEDETDKTSSDTNKQNTIDSKNKDVHNKNTTGSNKNNSHSSLEKNDTKNFSDKENSSHTHKWVDIINIIHHPAETKEETVVVKKAWTEYVPVYETTYHDICHGCGGDYTGRHAVHAKEEALKGNYACGGCYTMPVSTLIRTDKIEHPEETKTITVTVQEPWMESVVVGQKCSECGKTK